MILKLVNRGKNKPKYKVGDIVKCEHIGIPLAIIGIKKNNGGFRFFYILNNGIIVPEDSIVEVVDEQ